MAVTGPAVRRRNHAWLQMRSLERQGLRLARRDDAEDEAETSGDESEDDKPTTARQPSSTARQPSATASAGIPNGGKGVILIPKPTQGPSLGETLGAGEPDKPDDEPKHEEDHHEEEHHDTEDNSSTTKRPPQTTSSATTTKSAKSSTTSASATTTNTSLDHLVTSLTGIPLPTTTTAPSLTVPVTGSTQSEEAEPDNEGLTVAPAPNKLSGGAVAGIVLGVLAFVGLLIGAAFLWRRIRRDRGLPFFPQTRFRLRDDESSHPPSVTGPLPGKVGGPNQAKTNTQIMDDLMKAAYAAQNAGGNNTNDMEVAYASAASMPKLPPNLQQHPAYQHEETANAMGIFMDEKAYAALERPPTPGEPKKPVMKWLSEVKTPVQPNGPEIPPTPKMPPSVGRLTVAYGGGGGRVPEQPRPAYFGRETMTTETTETSVRWYG